MVNLNKELIAPRGMNCGICSAYGPAYSKWQTKSSYSKNFYIEGIIVIEIKICYYMLRHINVYTYR